MAASKRRIRGKNLPVKSSKANTRHDEDLDVRTYFQQEGYYALTNVCSTYKKEKEKKEKEKKEKEKKEKEKKTKTKTKTKKKKKKKNKNKKEKEYYSYSTTSGRFC
ncbi:hypothetical protein QTP86_019813 [Hemibagrus guttatus]|nr:hypothetical protein QTP86_019813 [Hemibagrus guttatus]